ncbi:substrate-binding periplasmic protein [Denitromonas ohlonensis]|uniref:Amino acid ABC transporter substrate-binding protein n=2 Tax=Denitromonas TaxID=139331 RepID=A0A557RLA5_9RHOO|nr:transporter substrate-binding domain-containing protein [Denitromonas ohlonensis]TVO65895.1 amino acid ABC transporter substrate-binding protein [Denitromonas ohlonensis]TVO79488.1 amino acid ABC transporter substrate-binding protein [Denitromonas ohlonensis]
MKNNLRRIALGSLAAVACLAASLSHATAADALEIQQPGRLRVAVYADFPPYSAKGKGVDIAIGRELAKRMGLTADVVEVTADEDMNDDLRNMVWKGHYLGTRPGDVMLHVPVDQRLAELNDKVRIFAPYHLESLAVARDPARVPPVKGSAATALEVFTREKVGVETASLADDFLLGVLNGRLRDNVVHFKTVNDAVAALKAGSIAAVMASRAEIEGALGAPGNIDVGPVSMPELRIKGWSLGMAVKADSTVLAEALSQAMIDIQRDGTLARIFKEHGITHQTP